MEEFWELFDGFRPRNQIINRVTESIKMEPSAMENITLAILSDR